MPQRESEQDVQDWSHMQRQEHTTLVVPYEMIDKPVGAVAEEIYDHGEDYVEQHLRLQSERPTVECPIRTDEDT
jgi:hypothetical protein